MNAFLEGMSRGIAGYQATAGRRARTRATSSVLAGDPYAAEQAYLEADMPDEALAVRRGVAQDSALAEREQQADQARMAAERLDALKLASGALRRVPAEQRPQHFRATIAPALQARGLAPEMVEQLSSAPMDDASLDVFDGGVEQARLKVMEINGDIYGVNEATGETRVLQDNPDRPIATPFGIIYPPGQGSGATGTRPPTAPGNADSVFDSLIQQESGGRAGVLGPQTRYGQAQGMTQMLPATAQEMARKLGVAWRPELMTGTSPEAAEYQRTLGRAYYEQGLKAYGGDQRRALMYYHGGPNERLWGPKTRAYADQVLSRARMNGGSGRNAVPGGAGEDTLAAEDSAVDAQAVQDIGGGWTLQPMQTPSAQQSQQRDARDFGYRIEQDRRQEEQAARDDARADEHLNLARQAAARKEAPAPLPPRLQSAEDADWEALETAQSLNAQLGQARRQVETGALNLGPATNLASRARNAAGMSTPNSRNFASFRATLERIRNDSLRLNKGVQTEGDAQRAWNELLTNINDEKLVAQRLREIERLNARAVIARRRQIDRRRAARGIPPVTPDPGELAPFSPAQRATGARMAAGARGATPGSRTNPIAVASMVDFDNLEIGQHYIARDGKVYLKRARQGGSARATGGATPPVRRMSNDDLRRSLGL